MKRQDPMAGTKSIHTNKMLWLIIGSNLLLGVDLLVHCMGLFKDMSSLLFWSIHLAFLALLIPIYSIATIHLLCYSNVQSSPPPPIDSEPLANVDTADDETNTGFHDAPIADPQDAVAQWIADRRYLDPNVTIDKTLEQIGISLTTLNYYLEHHAEAVNFRRWLTHLRIEEAKRLMLAHPGYSLQAIAEACGYSNNQSLTKAFKMQEGIPPSEWLANHKNQ